MNKSYSSMVHEAGGHDHMTFGESEARAMSEDQNIPEENIPMQTSYADYQPPRMSMLEFNSQMVNCILLSFTFSF